MYMSTQLSGHFFYAVDVLDCIDYLEYDALHKNEQEIIRFILSTMFVNLSEDSKSRQKLENYFPLNTATGTALGNLIASHIQPWVGELT